MANLISTLTQQERINFLLTNRIPRRALTKIIGWYSRIESKWLTKLTLAIWKKFAHDLDLSEAKKTHFSSLQDCFIRELKAGVRPIDAQYDSVISPCDAIVGECGHINGSRLFQAKGFPYDLSDLIPDVALQKKYRNGIYCTLRLKSSMYHRFHAPIEGDVTAVTYISGDTWNVNPIALKRIEKLYCKNERAVMTLHAQNPDLSLTLVPVAAILVASMKFHCLPDPLDMKYKGPNVITVNEHYQKGDELGYFQHGSTIIVFATSSYRLLEHITPGKPIKMGQPLMKQPRMKQHADI